MKLHRIMIVDDEPAFTGLVKKTLERTGRFVVRAENGAATAVASALEFQPEVILMDVVLPEHDGGEILTEMQTHRALRDVPAFFLTACATQRVAQALAGQVQCRSILSKPIDPATLIRHIDSALAAS
jgi:CheY-like chemotaxis protein